MLRKIICVIILSLVWLPACSQTYAKLVSLDGGKTPASEASRTALHLRKAGGDASASLCSLPSPDGPEFGIGTFIQSSAPIAGAERVP